MQQNVRQWLNFTNPLFPIMQRTDGIRDDSIPHLGVDVVASKYVATVLKNEMLLPISPL